MSQSVLLHARCTCLAPLAFDAGDSNFYRYVANNSPNVTDPTGLAGVADQPKVTPRSIRILSHNKEPDGGGFGKTPKLGPLVGEDYAKYAFVVHILTDSDKESDIMALKIEQRIWKLNITTPREGVTFGGELGKNKKRNAIMDINGSQKFISDEAAAKALDFWKKEPTDFWKSMYPDVTTSKKDVGKEAKNNTFRYWLLDPDFRLGPDEKHKNGVVRLFPEGNLISYVDSPGFEGISAKDSIDSMQKMAIEIKATGTDGTTITARFKVEIEFKSDGKTWSVKGAPKVSPPEIESNDRGKSFFKPKE
jgi:hypothetical protein